MSPRVVRSRDSAEDRRGGPGKLPSEPMATTINERVIRWSEIRLPDPRGGDELVHWKVDGPFALRSYYRVPGTDAESGTIRLELSHRAEDGTIERCLHCSAGALEERVEAPWGRIALVAVPALALAPFTFGLSLLLAAYPLWFLWKDAPRVQRCAQCRAEFVDFRFGPRP